MSKNKEDAFIPSAVLIFLSVNFLEILENVHFHMHWKTLNILWW